MAPDEARSNRGGSPGEPPCEPFDVPAPKNRRAVIHPLAGARPDVFWTRRRAHAPYDRPGAGRVLAATTCALLTRAPCESWERWRWRARLERTAVPDDPVFIVGHWRSGTTLLHNLISQDPQFAWLSLGQAVIPGNMLGAAPRLFYRLLRRWIPRKRSFDNVPLGVDAPQEEEIALGALSPLSYFNCYYYPREFLSEFRRCVLLEGVADSDLSSFAAAYRLVAGKLSLLHPGRTLLFKNPSSTARTPFLLRVFPQARFIHVVRNPYEVFCSSLKRLPAMLNAFALQSCPQLDLPATVLTCYQDLLSKWLADRPGLPTGAVAEVRYEDLAARPVETVERLYGDLGLPGWTAARDRIGAYATSLQGYEPNVHKLTPLQQRVIARDWAFAFDHWGYARSFVPAAASQETDGGGPAGALGRL